MDEIQNLEDLIEQKKKIEAQIKELRGKALTIGDVCIKKPNGMKYWQLSIRKLRFGKLENDRSKYAKLQGRKGEMWIGVAESYNKKDVVEAIPTIINNLLNLHSLLTEKE